MTYRDRGSGGDNQNGDQVVEFTAISLRNVRPILAQREARWEDMRGERLASKRSEISPQFLQGALAHLFVHAQISSEPRAPALQLKICLLCYFFP